jgi:hypothetical protein
MSRSLNARLEIDAMNKLTKFASAVGLVCSFACAPAIANELLLVDSGLSKSGRVFSLDFNSDGRGTAIEARIDVGATEKGVGVDVSKCAGKLPATHTGSCVFNGKEVVILVYSATNALLPAGMIDLGTVSVSGSAGAELAKGMRVTSFILAAPDATELRSSVVADSASK